MFSVIEHAVDYENAVRWTSAATRPLKYVLRASKLTIIFDLHL